MFGYVVINKPELKIKDYDKYQEYYCGLCQSLKQNHGRRGQLTLNYDLNFVGILLSSLYEPTDKQYLIRCPLHPFHKKSVRTNQYMDYVSDMNIVLTYYKLEDDVLDEIAGQFGHIMANICVYQEDVFKDDLYQMGFYLGKFIYLIDAFEDVEEDIKKQTYNPFKNKFKEEHFQEYCFNILEMMISRSSFYFEKLPLIENVELLRNIIYSGIWTKFELIKKKRMEEKS